MKKFNLPLLGCELYVFREDEKPDFEKRCGRLESSWYGCCSGNAIWIGSEKGKRVEGIIAHELSHYVDWLIETRLEMKVSTLDSVGEMRGYILQYLYPLVSDYIMEEA